MKHTHLLHTQMIEAIEAQDLAKVRNLVAEGVKVNYINNSRASSAIEAATRLGNIEIVDFLLESKADPNKWYTRSPLAMAIDKKLLDIANLLIDAGADVNTDPEIDCTPLMLAISIECIQLVKKLIDGGADVDLWGRESNSPLSMAGYCGNKEIYEYIFPLTDPSFRNIFLKEGLFNAVIDESLIGLEFLASTKADINCQDDLGETPLMCAIKNGHPASAKKLI